jgi:hypothetical protein
VVREIPRPKMMAKKVVHELREYAVISVYLYICLGALILFKSAILSGQGVNYAPFGLAAVKALVLGKFVLLGRAAALGERYRQRRAIYVIAHKALLFLMLLLVLSVVEELVVGYFHGRTSTESLSTFLGGSLLQIFATSVVVLLILVPYFAYGELARALGEDRVRRILLDSHNATARIDT